MCFDFHLSIINIIYSQFKVGLFVFKALSSTLLLRVLLVLLVLTLKSWLKALCMFVLCVFGVLFNTHRFNILFYVCVCVFIIYDVQHFGQRLLFSISLAAL